MRSNRRANFLRGDPDIELVGYAPATDLELLQRSVAQPSDFAEVYDRHAERVLRYIARRVGLADAEDIAAEVFVRAYGRRASCRGEHGSVLPWLFGVANHVIADHRRVERRRLEALGRLAESAAANVSHERADLAPELVRALKRLPAADRDALLLVVWGELSYDETAAALEVPVGTVRSRIARARERLIKALGDDVAPVVRGLGGEGAANA